MNLDRLTTLRKNKNWSLQYTADRLGIAKSTYAGYESGYRRPSLEALSDIADLFATSTDYLLSRVDDPKAIKNNNCNEPIELTNWGEQKLSVDGVLLSEEEMKQMVAFIRVKKILDQQ
ncbi:helix-turn-helix transcriptional regulator [Bacillus sp. CLL-7-23]|uniref:Helix-turn-helix transcriptional regulator n=1 Tax=Bacillus changyiensis TaxID=3004103 RepID=A0ABT4WYW4_9BACI|nr:helix-turn-helix transcriptional regulator [Bacillus changyiensis]MDA7025230.1 helix-turn-helix transcriptional regulator [Bacillus changyiensis]